MEDADEEDGEVLESLNEFIREIDTELNKGEKYPGYKYFDKMKKAAASFMENIKKLAGEYPHQLEQAQKTMNNIAMNIKIVDEQMKSLSALNEKIKKNPRKYRDALDDEPFTYALGGYNRFKKVNTGEAEIEVMTAIGTKKTAARWIEEIQTRIKNGADITIDDITQIIAARQLANTVPGSSTRLEKTILTEGQLKARAKELLDNEAFRDYLTGILDKSQDELDFVGYNNFSIPREYLTDGHGGELEINLAKTVKAREDISRLPSNLFCIYQKMAKFSNDSYQDFIDKNKKDYTLGGKKKITPQSESVALHAANMLAAYKLKKEAKVNASRFAATARDISMSPEFRFMRRHYPESMNLLAKGDFKAFFDELNNEMTEPENNKIKLSEEEKLEQNIVERARFKEIQFIIDVGLAIGVQVGTIKEYEGHVKHAKHVSEFGNNYTFLGEKGVPIPENFTELRKTISDHAQKMEDYEEDREVLGSKAKEPIIPDDDILKFLEQGLLNLEHLNAVLDNKDAAKEQKNKLTKEQQAKKRSDIEIAKQLSPLLLKALNAGEKCYKIPEFTDTKKKTKEVQEKEFVIKQKRAFYKAAQNYIDTYVKLYKQNYNKELSEKEKHFIKDGVELKVSGAKTNKEYLEKRGIQYRKMYEAAKEYEEKYTDKADPSATFKLIDSILDYQKGKEKVMTGFDKIRFDNSMRLLADITCGTHFEKYFENQLARINKIRGVKPGSANYLTKENYFDNYSRFVADVKNKMEREKKYSFDTEPVGDQADKNAENNAVNNEVKKVVKNEGKKTFVPKK